MDSRRLKLFIILAEELHFGRAARRAGIAQSALSQQIKRLETEVGAPVFARSTREVRLTGVGEGLVYEARAVLDRMDQAMRVAKTLASGKTEVMRVGVTTVAAFGDAPELIAKFRQRFPDVEIQLREIGTVDQESALATREIDVGFLHPPIDSPELEVKPRPASRFVAMVRTGERPPSEPLLWSDCLRQPLIFYGRRRAPRLYDALISAAHTLGVSPEIAAEARSFLSAVAAAAAGLGTALVPAELRRAAPATVTVYELTDCPVHLQNGVVTRREAASACTCNFLEFIEGDAA